MNVSAFIAMLRAHADRGERAYLAYVSFTLHCDYDLGFHVRIR